jgi:hypothetical protein
MRTPPSFRVVGAVFLPTARSSLARGEDVPKTYRRRTEDVPKTVVDRHAIVAVADLSDHTAERKNRGTFRGAAPCRQRLVELKDVVHDDLQGDGKGFASTIEGFFRDVGV